MTDQEIARKYLDKIHNAKQRNIEFNLSLTAFKNLMRAKKCRYTKMVLTEGKDGALIVSDRTIDRKDSSKGYIKGNCVAVCHGANQFKSIFENPKSKSKLAPELAARILKFIK